MHWRVTVHTTHTIMHYTKVVVTFPANRAVTPAQLAETTATNTFCPAGHSTTHTHCWCQLTKALTRGREMEAGIHQYYKGCVQSKAASWVDLAMMLAHGKRDGPTALRRQAAKVGVCMPYKARAEHVGC
jgi:hypothetical protein